MTRLPDYAAHLAGTRGTATVGSMLLTLALVGGALFMLRTGESVKQLLGELVAETALGAVLSRLPGGFLASITLGLKSDNQYEIKMTDRIDEILSAIPDFDKLPAAEMKSSRATIRGMIENPLVIEPPAEPFTLGDWPPSPSSQGSAGGSKATSISRRS